mmetsp:Transcript_21689/g.51077  ORF Transcript_21689/g.51077 Transcript_21689/m.51077 type:complete len:684 (-) Transcript_21689:37-2088(-)
MGQFAGDTIRWNCKRDRLRLQARYRIQSKIKAICHDESAFAPASSTLSESEMLTVSGCLEAIITNDISTFSVNNLAWNGHLVQTLGDPLSKETRRRFDQYMSTNLPCGSDNVNLRLPQPTTLATSKFGEAFVSERLVPYMKWLVSRGRNLSVIEYASLLGRHNIVQNLLLGGIDPTRHIPSSRNDVTDLAILARKKILSLFHSSSNDESDTSSIIPIELWTYMIRSVIEMRMNAALEARRQGEESNFLEEKIQFGAPCHHSFCEPVMWIHLAEHVPAVKDLTKNVVTCPLCAAEFQGFQCVRGKTHEVVVSCNNTEEGEKDNEDCTVSLSTEQRRLESLAKYHCLPSSSVEAKKWGRKKGRREKFCSTWGEALTGIIHSAQPRPVRSERFFRAILQSLQFTIGYLQAGVDVNMQNEYGQTPLYIACWQGKRTIVEALLDHGADSSIPANGGSTCYSVAARFKRTDVMSLLDLHQSSSREKGEMEAQPHRNGQIVSMLLDPSIDHPGAGSMLIDDAICESQLARLVQIHNSLPLNESPEGSKRPSRSYFCDAELEVQVFLKNCVDTARAALSAVAPKERNAPLSVFDHMRFLEYTEIGGILPPHVDLSRTDKRSGLRSTHTFILYLTDCEDGGGTALLQQLKDPKVLAVAQPKRGRALIFPHNCPHSGLEVKSAKLLLRGEVIL